MSDVKVVGPREAISLLANAVRAKGTDFIYATEDGQSTADASGVECQYLHTDPIDGAHLVPGCIVGHVMVELGVPMSVIAGVEGLDAGHLCDVVNSDPSIGIRFTYEASRVLSLAQTDQDMGETWGTALETAENYITMM